MNNCISIILIVLILLLIIYIKSNDGCTITLFHAPDCGYCIKLKPEWESFMNMAPDNVSLRSVDIRNPQNEFISNLYGVKTVPLIVKEKYGKKIIYSGDRTAKDLYNFSLKKLPF